MQTILKSLSGWARMEDAGKEGVLVIDAALTVVGGLLVALALTMAVR